jgi:Ca2+-binding EF-hand superfamily protein
MSVSSVGSSNPYSTLQWPQTGGTDSTDQSSSPSDPLQALLQSTSGGGSSDPLLSAIGQGDSSASSQGLQFSPDVMQALLSVQGDQPPAGSSSSVQSLFNQIDANGDGSISESEFESALGSAGADKTQADQLFSKIDTNGDGSISSDEMQSAMQKAHGGGHHHHHHAGGAGGSGGSDPLQSLLASASADGTTSQSTTNSDGSTTTTLTYTDGTTVEMTTPAAASSDSGSNGPSSNRDAPNFANLMKQLISMQAQLATPTTNLSV